MFSKPAKSFLLDLLSTPSPTGWEVEGQRKWADYAREFADAVENDAYGNTWATIPGTDDSAPTLMLEAHADEIGFIVKHVTKDGYLRIDRIGGSDVATARGRRVEILGEKGHVHGVIGNTAIHLRDRSSKESAPETHELYVDTGASSAEEIAQQGIRVGTPMVYADGAEFLGKDRLLGRALDNRVGGFIIAEVLRRVQKHGSPAATVHAANCVHEEIGGMGSLMVAHRLHPGVCIVLDVTHATDSPGIAHDRYGEVKLGGGPTLTHGAANHTGVVRRLMEVASGEKIHLQHEAASRYTGTDADRIYHTRDGIPTALVSLPLRYMHSVVEVADLQDIERVVKLLAAFALSLRTGDHFTPDIA